MSHISFLIMGNMESWSKVGCWKLTAAMISLGTIFFRSSFNVPGLIRICTTLDLVVFENLSTVPQVLTPHIRFSWVVKTQLHEKTAKLKRWTRVVSSDLQDRFIVIYHIKQIQQVDFSSNKVIPWEKEVCHFLFSPKLKHELQTQFL